MTRAIRRRWVFAAAAFLILSAGAASAAQAADATGCSGSAVSTDASGQLLDNVKAPGVGGTQSDPFVVDLDGSVAWKGSTTTALKGGTWSVTAGGVPVRSGDVTNDSGQKAKAGDTNLAELPAAVKSALQGATIVPVVADISASNGSCSATVYVTTATPAAFTPLWVAGLILVLTSLLLLLFLFLGTTVSPYQIADADLPSLIEGKVDEGATP